MVPESLSAGAVFLSYLAGIVTGVILAKLRF
jgi:hypothetical protein